MKLKDSHGILRIGKICKERRGTTLVEMMACLMLISIMLLMAARGLSSASRVFLRLQKSQYAQSILDTAMTELRNVAGEATGYVKIYPDGTLIAGQEGEASGTALEFLDSKGYVRLLSTDGCEATALYRGDEELGTFDAVEAGGLLTRYYSRSNDGTYICQKDGTPVARAIQQEFTRGFYMGNYLEIVYRVPDGTQEGERVDTMVVTVNLYEDKEHRKLAASDAEVLDFRYEVKYTKGITAK